MINWFKDLAWIVQIRWIIYLNKKKRHKNYGWDNKKSPPYTW